MTYNSLCIRGMSVMPRNTAYTRQVWNRTRVLLNGHGSVDLGTYSLLVLSIGASEVGVGSDSALPCIQSTTQEKKPSEYSYI